MTDPGRFPGAEEPDRQYRVDSCGVQIAVHEWGDIDAPIVMMTHGTFDFARTFDVFAPALARLGWRVVAWDHRGHGDSARADLYSYEADVRDAAAVFDTVGGREPVAAVGHSKGGAILLQLAHAEPFRFRGLVTIDGSPSKRPNPEAAELDRDGVLESSIEAWLSHRGRAIQAERRPGSLEELADRRGRVNPRASDAWLRYLVTVGAEQQPDGWRWKLDPSIRLAEFEPWRPQSALARIAAIGVPYLCVLVGIYEEMGWGVEPHEIEPVLSRNGRIELLADIGHFAHVEQPERVASLINDFLVSIND